MILSTESLRVWMERNFPPTATCWSQATDEVRDMSRCARELAGFSELHAFDFSRAKSPSEWNTHGIHKTVEFYSHLSASQREAFCAQFNHWLSQTVVS